MRYYWCINCGFNGDFGFSRKRNIKCKRCDYNDIVQTERYDFETAHPDTKRLERRFWKKRSKL